MKSRNDYRKYLNFYLEDCGVYNEEEKNLYLNLVDETLDEIKENDISFYNAIRDYDDKNKRHFLVSLLQEEVEDAGKFMSDITMGVLLLTGLGGILVTPKARVLYNKISDSINNMNKNLKINEKGIKGAINDLFSSKKERLINEMFKNNYSNCIERCELPIEDGKIKKIFMDYIKTGNFRPYEDKSQKWKNILSYIDFSGSQSKTIEPSDIEKGECFINCYLDYVTSAFSLLARSYLNCLKMTNGISDEFPATSVNVLLQFPTTEKCETVHKEVDKVYTTFKDLLDELVKDQKKRMMWIEILDKKVKDSNYNNYQQQNVPSYPSTSINFGDKKYKDREANKYVRV